MAEDTSQSEGTSQGTGHTGGRVRRPRFNALEYLEMAGEEVSIWISKYRKDYVLMRADMREDIELQKQRIISTRGSGFESTTKRDRLVREWNDMAMQLAHLDFIIRHQDMLLMWRDYGVQDPDIINEVDQAEKEGRDLFEVVTAKPLSRMQEMILEEVFGLPIEELRGDGRGKWHKEITDKWIPALYIRTTASFVSRITLRQRT